MLRFLHELDTNLFDGLGHGGREEEGLAFFWHSADNGLDVLQEAHVEHFICLVQNQGFHLVQTKSLAFDKV